MDMTPKPEQSEMPEQEEGPSQGIDMTEAGPSDVGEETENDGGYEICIKVKGEKSYSVYVRRPGEDSALADEGSEFELFGDAMRETMRLRKENGAPGGSAVSQMQAGFGSPEQKY